MRFFYITRTILVLLLSVVLSDSFAQCTTRPQGCPTCANVPFGANVALYANSPDNCEQNNGELGFFNFISTTDFGPTSYPLTVGWWPTGNANCLGSAPIATATIAGPFPTAAVPVPQLTGLTGGDSYTIAVWSTSDNIYWTSNQTVGIQGTNPDSATLANNVDVMCPGGSILLTADEVVGTGTMWGASTEFQWYDGAGTPLTGTTALPDGGDQFTITATGTYYVDVTDNGCTRSSDIITITDLTLTITVTETTTPSCGGNTDGEALATASGGTLYNYVWSTSQTDNNAVNSTGTGLTDGTVYTITATESSVPSCSVTGSVTMTPAPLGVTLTGTTILNHENCPGANDGRITANATGGATPYTFSWSNGSNQAGVLTDTESGLAAGSYSVTVIDNVGCRDDNGASPDVITVSPAITINESATDETCPGACDGVGITNPTPGSGTGFVFNWSNGGATQNISGLCPAVYTVTVSNVGAPAFCQQTASVTISTTPSLTITSADTDPTCSNSSDGAVNLSVSGGETPYTYLWDNGATSEDLSNLSCSQLANNVTVTDNNGCTDTYGTTLTCPGAITVSSTVTPPSCFGVCDGSIDVAPTGGTPNYSYSWSTGSTDGPAATDTEGGLCGGLAPGGQDYTVTVTDAAGCTVTETINVTASPGITLTDAIISHESCPGASDGEIGVTVTGGLGTYDFDWSNGTSFTLIGNSTSENGLTAGSYTITATDVVTGCQDNTDAAPSVITVSPAITVNESAIDETCAGACDGIGVTAPTGGSGAGFVFNWSSGAATQNSSGLCDGTYTVTVNNVGAPVACQQVETVTVDPASAITPNGVTVNPTCAATSDGSITYNPNGGFGPYDFNWSNGGSSTNQVTHTENNLPTGVYTTTITDANSCVTITSVTLTSPPAITVATNSTNITCANQSSGTASVTVTGGETPYAYAWNTGATTSSITGLGDGVYTVNISATGSCTTTESFTLTEPTDITITTTVDQHEGCVGSDGQATAVATGGTSPYTFNWSTGSSQAGVTTDTESSLTAGAYTLTVVDASGCTDNDAFNITASPAITLTVVVDQNESCVGNDGEATATATGGTSPFTFNWSTGSSQAGVNSDTEAGLAAGNYTVTATDGGGCSRAESFTVTGIPPVTVTAVIDNQISCNGGSDGQITASGSGGTAPFDFFWTVGGPTFNAASSTKSNLSEGTYGVTIVDDNGCTDNTSITLTAPSAITTTLNLTMVDCNGESNGVAEITATGGTSDYAFSWSTGRNTANATTDTHTGLAAGTYSVTTTDDAGCTNVDNFTITENSLFTTNATVTDASCSGKSDGQITVSGSGGQPPFDFEWSLNVTTTDVLFDVQTGLAPGVYTITVLDDLGCESQEVVTVEEPTAITVSMATTSVTCNGESSGTATATATGSVSPYTFDWESPGGTEAGVTTSTQTGYPAGVYTLTVTDDSGNNCSVTESFTITEPTTLDANAVVDNNVSCNGSSDGQITSTPTGGTSPYDFSWSNGASATSQASHTINGLAAGSYTVTVTDNNTCTDIETVTVTEPASITVSITTTGVSCSGSSDATATANPSGGSGTFSYQWSNGQITQTAIGLTNQAYTVTVTDIVSSCTVSEGVTISPANPIVYTVTTTDVSCFGGSDGAGGFSSVSGGVSPYSYNWGGVGNTPNAQSNSGLTCNTYNVTITDVIGCTTVSPVNIDCPPALTVTGNVTDAQCFGESNGSIDVTTSGGTTGYTFNWNNGANTEDISAIPAGTYTLTVTDNNSCEETYSGTVTENSQITASTTTTDATCGVVPCNGEAGVSAVSGGTSGYTYQWDPGTTSQTTPIATGLCGGTYSVTITDSSPFACFITVSEVINAIGGASITITTVTDETCIGDSDGSMQAVASGGTTPYTYQWFDGASNPIAGQTSTSITGITGGTYEIVVTDNNGCTDSDVGVVAPGIDISVTETIVNVACFGDATGSITLVSAGSSPYLYAWSNGETTNGISGLIAGVYIVTVDATASSCQDNYSYTITQPASAVDASNTNFTNVTCNGGSDGTASVISPYGGTAGGYNFLWSDPANQTTANASNLAAGIYNVTVTDINGCTDVSPDITISEPTAISLTTATSNFNGFGVSCFGGSNGSVTVTASGGNTPYSYSWDSNAGNASTAAVSNLGANTYSVTVTAAFGTCPEVTTVTLDQPNAITITSTVTQPSCNNSSDGEVAVNVTGGVTNYSYLWSDPASQTNATATGLSSGSYTLSVTDANTCSETESVTLSAPNALSVTSTVTDVACNGESSGAVSVTASGGTTPYNYIWDDPSTSTGDDITNIPVGVYTVTVSDDNGCNEIVTNTVTEPTAITLTLNSTDATCGNSDGSITVTANGGTTGYSYLWDGGQTTPVLSNQPAGNYSVTVTDSNNCTANANGSINNIGAPTVTLNTVDATCFGASDGSATANVTTTDPPTTYNWSNGDTFTGGTTNSATGLSAGVYNLSVTNNSGCLTASSFTISEPNEILANEVITHVSCAGPNTGQIVTNATGGKTTSYTYAWTPAPAQAQASATVVGLSVNTYNLTITDMSVDLCNSTFSFDVTATPSLTLTDNVSDVACFGDNDGSVTVTATGGASTNYTYAWSSGETTAVVNNLVAGSYTVTSTDGAACSDIITVTVGTAPAITISSSTNAATCNQSDGSITVVVTGGTTPYSYLWDDPAAQNTATATGLAAGNYVVNVSATGSCTTSSTITLNNIAFEEVSFTGKDTVSCFNDSDGELTALITCTDPPCTLQWMTGGQTTQTATGLPVGTQFITVTNNSGCITIADTLIINADSLGAGETVVDVNCNGASSGSISLAPFGGKATTYTYAWGGGQATSSITGLPTGSYDVTVTDQSSFACSNNFTFDVTTSSALTITNANVNDVTCNGYSDGSISINVSGGSSPYTFSWSTGATSQNISNLPAAVYTVTVSDLAACDYTESFTVSEPSSITITSVTQNPTCLTNNGSITVTPVGGTSPYLYNWSSGGNNNIENNLFAGAYTVTVTDLSATGTCSATETILLSDVTAENVTVTADTVSCFNDCDGELDASTACLSGPCNFLWSDGQNTQTATGLCAGDYIVTVTNGSGCRTIATDTVFNVDSIGAAEAITHISCFGSNSGAINLNAFGGRTTTYTYLWNTAPVAGETTASVTGLSANTYNVNVVDDSPFNCSATFNFDVTVTPAMSITNAAITSVTCNGQSDGDIDITVAGGTSPYTYAWDNGATTEDISNLTAATYVLQSVTDASGCTVTDSYTVTEPTALTITVDNVTSVSCFGGSDGSATISVTGGTTGYSFLWNDGQNTSTASNLSAGVSTVTVTDANGCTASESITISQPASGVTVSVTVTDLTCNGVPDGTATAIPSGGASGYSYLWNDFNDQTTQTANNLLAAPITVTVTDQNGCSSTGSNTVSEPSAIVVNSTTQPTACTLTDGAITITPSGGTGTTYTYLWGGGAVTNIDGETTQVVTGLASGSYDVTVTDQAGCTAEESGIIINNFGGVSITNATVTPPSCTGYNDGRINIAVAGGNTPYSFLWNPDPNLSAQTDQNANGVTAGTYQVVATDDDGCFAQEFITVSEPTPMNAVFTSVEPTCGDCNGQLSVAITGGSSAYNFVWSSGGTSSGSLTASESGLCAGVYEISVTDVNGCSETFNTGLSNNDGPSSSTVTLSSPSCFGFTDGSGSITVTGGQPPYSYFWFGSGGINTQTATGLGVGNYSIEVTDANNCKLVVDTAISAPDEIVDSVSTAPTTCNGGTTGSIDVFISGGVGPYQYIWNTGGTTSSLNNLPEGALTLTVNDFTGCTNTFNYYINGDPSANVTATANDVQCFGESNGSFTAGAVGGTTPYSFEWFAGATSLGTANGVQTVNETNLPEGTYLIEVTDGNLCKSGTFVDIEQPTEISFSSAVANAVSCFGDSDGRGTVIAVGGNFPYTYAWDANANNQVTSTATGLIPGTYYVTVSDANSCEAVDSVLITSPSQIVLDTNSVTSVICSNGSNGFLDLVVTGGSTPFTYNWSNGATTEDISGLAAGTYCVTAVDNSGCSEEACFIVGGPVVSIVGTDVSCFNGSDGRADLTATGANTPFVYLWNPPPGIGSQTNEDAFGLSVGVYGATVTDTLGCSTESMVTIGNAIEMQVSFTAVNATCGDCDGQLTAVVTGGAGGYSYLWSNNGTAATQSGMCAGVYELFAQDANGCEITDLAPLSNVGGPDAYTLSVTSASCFGTNDATATINASGGTTPYTYNWIPTNPVQTGATATGLEVQTYTVEVIDANNCKLVVDTAVAEPSQITDSLISLPTSCGGSDGSLTVFVSGGAGTPYTYLWDNGSNNPTQTGLAEGTIRLTVTDNSGCDEQFTYSINGSNAPSITLTAQDVTCFGSSDGSIVSNVEGGITAYSYTWLDINDNVLGNSATISGLPAGEYTLSVTDAAVPTCNANASINITQPDSVQFSAAVGIDPTCFNSSDGSVTVVPIGGTLPYSFNWDGIVSSSSTANNLPSGMYYLTVTDANGCANADSAMIQGPDSIIVDTVAANTSACSPGTIDIQVTGGTGTSYTYIWNNGEVTEDISGLGTGTYCVTVTDGVGCSEEFCFTIGGPAITGAVATDVSCFNGADGSIDLTVFGGATPLSYQWQPFGSTQEDPTGLEAGTYDVTVMDAAGCYDELAGTTVGTPDELTATFDTTSATCGIAQCDGSAQVNVLGGTSPYSYLWSSNETTDTDAALCAGLHSVSVTDDNGCGAVFVVALSNIGGPDSADVVATDVTCFGDVDGTAQVTNVYGGVSPYTYTWDGNPTGQGTPSVSGLGLGIVNVQIADQNNCIVIPNVTISGPSEIDAVANIVSTDCGATDGSITVIPSGGAGTPYTYNWTPGAANTATITGLSAGTSHSVVVTDANGCNESFTYNLGIYNFSLTVTDVQDASCSGASDGEVSITVSNPSATSFTYNWAPSGDVTANPTGLSAGTHSVTVTDNNGCFITDFVEIEEPDELSLGSLALNDISCKGLVDGAITVGYIGGTLPYTYSWSGGQSGPSLSNLTANTYTVSVTDTEGCIASSTITITEPDSINIDTVSVDPSLCAQVFTGGVDVAVSGGSAPYTYAWSNSSTTEDISGVTVGSYTITVTDFRNCTNSLTVIVPDSIEITITGIMDTSICESVTDLELKAVATVNPPLTSALSNVWVESNDTLATADSVIVQPLIGDNTYQFIAAYNGCTWDSIVTVTVLSNPDVEAGEVEDMILNGTREIGGDPTSVSAISYSWSPGIYLNDSTEANPEFTPEVDGIFNYTVTVVDGNGCVASDTLSILVVPEVDIVDLFSPNGDGINDTWVVPFLDQYPDAEVSIYNRWGELLYESKNGYVDPWDGTYNGTNLPIGTYYYVILLNHPDSEEPITGPVTIVR